MKYIYIFLLFTIFSAPKISLADNMCSRYFSKIYTTLSRYTVSPISIERKISNGSKLSFLENKWIENEISYIPYPKKRINILNKIENNKALNSEELSLYHTFIKVRTLNKKLRNKNFYKEMFVGGNKNFKITFGLEFELSLSRNPNIVNAYRPKIIPEHEWITMSFEQRLKIAKKIHKENTELGDIFVKIKGANNSLPEGLFAEPHGTLEGNGMIFSNLGDMNDFLDSFAINFGRADFQGHVVHSNKVRVQGISGYALFESDYGQLRALESNYIRFENDPMYIPGKTLVHPYLNPISENNKTAFQLYEIDVNEGLLEPSEVFSARTVNGPSFRIGTPYKEGLVGFELRQFHKNYEELLKATHILASELQNTGNLSRFKKFNKAKAIDHTLLKKSFYDFEIEVQHQDNIEYFFFKLDEVLKNMAAKKGSTIQGDLAPHERLFFALRPWEDHPVLEFLEASARNLLKNKIKKTRQNFIEEVMKIVEKADLDNLSHLDVQKMQVLNSKFAHEVQLSSYFSQYREGLMKNIVERPDFRIHTLPLLEDSVLRLETYQLNKSKIDVPVYSGKKLLKNPQYEFYKQNSIEVLFKDIGKFGHTEIRIGTRIYGFNDVKYTSNKVFSKQSKGVTGYVYRLNSEQIEKLSLEFSNIYKSSRKYNIPAFDAFSGEAEIFLQSKKYYLNNETSHNQKQLKGTIESFGKEKYIVAPSGYKEKIIQKNNNFFLQTHNCTSIIFDILNREIGMDFGAQTSAISSQKSLMKGKRIIPDSIIEY